VDQARVLDRDDCLVREGRNQGNLLDGRVPEARSGQFMTHREFVVQPSARASTIAVC
jgi:hypothetical protein